MRWSLGLLCWCLCVSTGAQAQVSSLLGEFHGDAAWSLARTLRKGEIEKHIRLQRQAWYDDETREHGVLPLWSSREPELQRNAMAHCHTDGKWNPTKFQRPQTGAPRTTAQGGIVYDTLEGSTGYPIPTIIRSVVPGVAVCPNWIPRFRGGKATHEYTNTVRSPAQLLPFPSSLIASLDSASIRWPEDGWFIGQLTRMRVENGQVTEALNRLVACGASEAWCELLRIYALDSEGKAASADSLLRRVDPYLPVEARCVLFSVAELLSPLDSTAYARKPCAERIALDARAWWIATPLFSEGGNTRRVAHVVRVVRILLATSLDFDAHSSLLTRYGADATLRMRLRYGWPDHHMWPGAEHTRQHTRYAGIQNDPPFWAAEYRIDAHAFVPSLTLLESPLGLRVGDESISPPDSVPAELWWPREFYRHPNGRITSSALGQVALFRRDSTALLIVSGVAGPEAGSDARSDSLARALVGRTVQMALTYSPEPAEARVLERRDVRFWDPGTLRGEISAPGLVGFEYIAGTQGVAGGRAHFGLSAVPTLRALPRGGCAVSDVLVLGDSAMHKATESFPDVLGGVREISARTLALGWETYGIPQRDSVTTEVEIVDRRTPSVLERTKSVLSGSASARMLRIAWTEPSTQAITRSIPAEVLTLERRVGLNLSQLSRGEYVLRVRVTRADGCQAISSPREISLR